MAGSVAHFSAAAGSALAAAGICPQGDGSAVDASLGAYPSPSAACHAESDGSVTGFFIVPAAAANDTSQQQLKPLTLTVSKSGSSFADVASFLVRPAPAIAGNSSLAALPDALNALRSAINAAPTDSLTTFFARCFDPASTAPGASCLTFEPRLRATSLRGVLPFRIVQAAVCAPQRWAAFRSSLLPSGPLCTHPSSLALCGPLLARTPRPRLRLLRPPLSRLDSSRWALTRDHPPAGTVIWTLVLFPILTPRLPFPCTVQCCDTAGAWGRRCSGAQHRETHASARHCRGPSWQRVFDCCAC
jgi:hypothetical protein